MFIELMRDPFFELFDLSNLLHMLRHQVALAFSSHSVMGFAQQLLSNLNSEEWVAIPYRRGRQPLARVPLMARERIFYGTPSDLTRM